MSRLILELIFSLFNDLGKSKYPMKKNVKEDAPTVNAGSGNVAGLGVGVQGEPGVKKDQKKPLVLSRQIWPRKK